MTKTRGRVRIIGPIERARAAIRKGEFCRGHAVAKHDKVRMQVSIFEPRVSGGLASASVVCPTCGNGSAFGLPGGEPLDALVKEWREHLGFYRFAHEPPLGNKLKLYIAHDVGHSALSGSAVSTIAGIFTDPHEARAFAKAQDDARAKVKGMPTHWYNSMSVTEVEVDALSDSHLRFALKMLVQGSRQEMERWLLDYGAALGCGNDNMMRLRMRVAEVALLLTEGRPIPEGYRSPIRGAPRPPVWA